MTVTLLRFEESSANWLDPSGTLEGADSTATSRRPRGGNVRPQKKRFGASRRQTRRSLTLSEIDAGYVFFMMSVTSRSPLSIPSVPLRPPVENTLRKTRRFEGGLGSYIACEEISRVLASTRSFHLQILSLRLPVRLPHKSSEYRVLLYRWQNHRTPASVSVSASSMHYHEHAKLRTRDPESVATRSQC
jgi:hypothetical protein